MILVNRASVPPPGNLLRDGASALKKLDAQYRRTKFAQQEPEFSADVYASATVVEALVALFENKCAFCETRIVKPSTENVEHFRPRMRAAGSHGDVAPIHYWWLAYQWENLYLSCISCRKAKSTHFPIAVKRADVGTKGEALLDEEPQLLDPCFDPPEKHLRFKGGLVMGLTQRGKVTIDILGLNRPGLVSARESHVEDVRQVMPQFMSQGLTLRRLENALYRHFRASRGGRQFFGLTKQLAADAHARGVAKSARKPAAAAAQSATSTDWGQLERVEIENFRAIQHLELKFPDLDPSTSVKQFGSDEQEPWIILLGNNGIGKSSVLKAIALALSSPAERDRFAPRPQDLVTRGGSAQTGRVRLWFSRQKEPHEWVFGKGRNSAASRPPVGPVLGYGSTRLLPSSVSLDFESKKPRIERAGNLFFATEPLSDAEGWLASRSGVRDADFDLLATDLRQLLALEGKDVLLRERNQLLARLYRKTLAVRELSDGFQSVLALTLDMMFNLSARTHDARNVPALVLLDEIEVHLHPSWKIRIVHDLRRIFRRSRFVVTTHDPLCVQGLAPGELHVMTRKDRSHRVEVRQIDVPLGLRSDQVLTGEWFGMGSTRDPDTLKLMERHSQLLLIAKRNATEESEKSSLEDQLRSRLGRFAESPYEQAGLRAYAELAPKRGTVVANVDKDELAARTRALFNQQAT